MTDTTRAHGGTVTIAFDGGCIGNPGPGGYGAILIEDGAGAETIVRGGEVMTTNNRMELSAAIAGLNALSPGASVSLLGDSQYVIKGMTEWLPGWKRKGWRTATGKPVLNQELWQALERAVQQHARVTWSWVRGHAGHGLNERVDAIANEEARRRAGPARARA